MDSITAMNTAMENLEQSVKMMKIDLAKARSAAVSWRKRYDNLVKEISTMEATKENKTLLAGVSNAEQTPEIIVKDTPTVTTYKGTDVYLFKNDVESKGYDPEKYSYDDMLRLAIEHKCFVIVKNGKGKWYIKCKGMDYMKVKQKVEDTCAKALPRYKNVMLYLVKL